jgi:hypothetical protein
MTGLVAPARPGHELARRQSVHSSGELRPRAVSNCYKMVALKRTLETYDELTGRALALIQCSDGGRVGQFKPGRLIAVALLLTAKSAPLSAKAREGDADCHARAACARTGRSV